MANRVGPSIINSALLPGISGHVFFEPASVKDVNDLHDYRALVFNFDAGRNGLSGLIQIPSEYASGGEVVLLCKSPATAGVVVFDVDYNVLNVGDGGDPSALQRSVTSGPVTVPSTARELFEVVISLNEADMVKDQELRFSLFRDGPTEGGGAAAAAVVVDAGFFRYGDT